MLRRAVADHRKFDIGLLEVLAMAVDVDRHLAAEHAAEVAHEHEHGQALAPQIAEPDRVSLGILEDHILERARVGWRVRSLPFADCVEHAANPNVPDGTLAPRAMERASTTTAGELVKEPAATEKA